ncbi:putative methyltransferase-like protein 7A [Synchiropus splendidus]|uniref:putative methyltransferase-like protein 7A n=1 Tax=Synchiropus splendidus TaxID=270530 RepID=UPI00237E3FA7|nr:putative methyltransferase-like protein 7A [Synchiropus splendidus]
MSFLCGIFEAAINTLLLPFRVVGAFTYKLYRRHFMPLLQYRMSMKYNKKMCDTKKELFRTLSDFRRPDGQLTVLEIGCGTGANFQFFPPGCKVICTDPNPCMQKYLRKSLENDENLVFERFVVASGEDLSSVEDESVDAVVGTLVLCTVKDVTSTLREARRVLRPGGGFLFLEHVVAEPSTWTHTIQQLIQPLWYYMGDGCRVNQATWKHLEAAGFSELRLRHVQAPLMFIVKQHIMGCAVK